MGATLSSQSTLAPVSFASTVVGFISFAFTLATFLNVFWSSLGTLYAAPTEISDYLSSLKQGLLEERHHLRRARKQWKKGRGKSRSDLDEGYGNYGGRGRREGGSGGSRAVSRSRSQPRPHGSRGVKGGGRSLHVERELQQQRSSVEELSLRTMRISIRDMIRSFRKLEYPFLRPQYQQQDADIWARGQGEKGWLDVEGLSNDDDEIGPTKISRGGLGCEYRKCGLRERWLWLRRKANVISLSEGLSRVEIRRIAHEVGEVSMMTSDMARDIEDMWDSVLDVEKRMGRIVGVRRVD